MSEKKRPNVTGKGPALTREMLEVFKEIEAGAESLSGDAAGKIKSALSEKGEELGKIVKMAYLKTVKAGETAWDCKEMALELKESVTSGNEDKAVEILDKLTGDLDQFIHKIKTFVVRMT
jgi:hypothetical protein